MNNMSEIIQKSNDGCEEWSLANIKCALEGKGGLKGVTLNPLLKNNFRQPTFYEQRSPTFL